MAMIDSVRFFCIFEDGSYGYERFYSEEQNLSILAVDYINALKEFFGLDAVSVTVMCEVKTPTRSRSCILGQYLIQGGLVYPVNPDFVRCVREVAQP